jgi:hypothetical protein
MVRTTSTNSSLPFPLPLAPADRDRAGDLQANVVLKDFCVQPVDAAANREAMS